MIVTPSSTVQRSWRGNSSLGRRRAGHQDSPAACRYGLGTCIFCRPGLVAAHLHDPIAGVTRHPLLRCICGRALIPHLISLPE